MNFYVIICKWQARGPIHAQLLVMGTASRTRLGGFIIGNTAESVLNQ